MKKITAIIALLALTGNTAGAELLKNFKYDGKIEVHSYQNANADWNDSVDDAKDNDTDTRVQVNLGFDLNADVDAVVSIVKNDREYGDGSQVVNDATGGGNGIMEQLVVEQAYMNLKGVLGLDHKLGRQYYGEEGDAVIYYGPLGWPYRPGLPVSALDAWTGWYKADKWDMHVLLANINNDFAGTQDQAVFGVAGNYNMTSDIKLGGYAYRRTTQLGTQVNDRLEVVGVKANGICPITGGKFKAEFAKNFGRNNELGGVTTPVAGNNNDNSYEGWMLLTRLSYDLELKGKLELAGEFNVGSGDDDSTDKKVERFYPIRSDFRRGIIGSGYAARTGLPNITEWQLAAAWTPESAEKVTLTGQFFHGWATEDKGLTYDELGSELDLTAEYRYSESATFKAYYGRLMPSKKYAVAQNGAGAKNDAQTQIGAYLGLKF